MGVGAAKRKRPDAAQGYTYRANENYVVVTRNGVQSKAPPNAPIQPDDVIKVPERYF